MSWVENAEAESPVHLSGRSHLLLVESLLLLVAGSHIHHRRISRVASGLERDWVGEDGSGDARMTGHDYTILLTFGGVFSVKYKVSVSVHPDKVHRMPGLVLTYLPGVYELDTWVIIHIRSRLLRYCCLLNFTSNWQMRLQRGHGEDRISSHDGDQSETSGRSVSAGLVGR